MRLDNFAGKPAGQAISKISQQARAWRDLDNDWEIALDQNLEDDQVVITAQDGSQLRAQYSSLGFHGNHVIDSRTYPDGSGTLFSGYDNLKHGHNVIRHPDGSYEGYKIGVVEEEAGLPAAPSIVDDLFGAQPPRKPETEPVLKMERLTPEEAKAEWDSAEELFAEWEIAPLGDLYDGR